eukprot:CAMPEP_0197732478 /NCGR_PEP_ID=MMETSP1434-20131217/40862_1 /TAXON_ID=265543 /ORGANISM="Minutocellus polymorphus, Strain CCMP3303" /LENGTH=44 /DNA_ID= /DNA_START= /DNA_END= /DNA_ORIENTATION=
MAEQASLRLVAAAPPASAPSAVGLELPMPSARSAAAQPAFSFTS